VEALSMGAAVAIEDDADAATALRRRRDEYAGLDGEQGRAGRDGDADGGVHTLADPSNH
jgi:hypothetical protein